MAYNAVAQVDEVASSSDSNSDAASPVLKDFQHLHDVDHLEDSPLEAAKTDNQEGLGRLGSMIRSMTTASYDIVEADDYDADPSPAEPSNRSSSLRRIPPLNTAVARHSSSPEPPLRSASSDLPITHPTPDLQSSQGAYVGNVARLEQSAEQLSSSSADIASEIRKMDQEQKRRSCSSASNSVNLRNGAFSPVTIASHGSTFSTRQRSVSGASRLAQLPEPDHNEDGHFLSRMPAPSAILPAPQSPIYTQPHDPYYNQYDAHDAAPEEIERPASAASGDTFQQARSLFTDFDGVHFAPLEGANSRRQLSLSQPPLASKPESYKEPQTGENMVYYPAPVPRMLNLPPKLSRKPISDREKRRTELLTNIVAEDRKSGAWLAGSEQNRLGDSERDRRQSKIPPQLRASLFFDKPSTTLEVDVKQDSAVATLDSILDASAHAPVSAFTDHPYAGQVGSYVFQQSNRQTIYKDPARQKAQRQSQITMGQRHSTRRQSDEEGSVSSHDGNQDESHEEHDSDQTSGSDTEGDEHSSESGESSEDEEEEEGFVDYVGPPNTLLAELDLRKQELKQRQRTFLPTASQAQGMHSTLLELDAMAQEQSDKRRRRPVTLAWNNRDTADDDDVPLAMLYPDVTHNDDDRPVGLMERRELEENEPLSTRRARLRGEPALEKRPVTVYETEIPQTEAAQPEADSDDEGETLAERMRRLRGQNAADSDFASELLAEIDTRTGVAPKEPEPAPAADALENETLAQRRARLKKQNGPPGGNAKNLHMRRSMATLPQNRSTQHIARQSSQDVLPYGNVMPGQYAHRMSMQSLPLNPGYQAPMGNQMGAQPYGYGNMNYPAAQAYNSMMMGVPGGMAYAMPAGCGPNMTQQAVDPAQQEFIDRWRQSIR